MGQNFAAQTALSKAGGVGYPSLDKAGNLQVNSCNENHLQVAASQTKALLGAVGAVGDELATLIIVPALAAAGAVTLYDGNGSTGIVLFIGGGTTALNTLAPIVVPLNIKALNAVTPGWYITTGASVSVVAIGNFT